MATTTITIPVNLTSFLYARVSHSQTLRLCRRERNGHATHLYSLSYWLDENKVLHFRLHEGYTPEHNDTGGKVLYLHKDTSLAFILRDVPSEQEQWHLEVEFEWKRKCLRISLSQHFDDAGLTPYVEVLFNQPKDKIE